MLRALQGESYILEKQSVRGDIPVKNKIIIIASILSVIILVQLLLISGKSGEEEIVDVFSREEFINKASSVEVLVDYGNRYISEEDKKIFITNIAKEIGLNDVYDYNIERNITGETSSITKEAKNASTKIKFMSLKKEIEENILELEQYIIVNINFKNDIRSVISYKETLEKALGKSNLKTKTTINLRGEYKGALSVSEKEELVKEFLKNIKGNIIEEKKNDKIYNVYAYTKTIDNHIIVEGESVNFNLVISYDEDNDLTKVLLATPIINMDY